MALVSKKKKKFDLKLNSPKSCISQALLGALSLRRRRKCPPWVLGLLTLTQKYILAREKYLRH